MKPATTFLMVAVQFAVAIVQVRETVWHEYVYSEDGFAIRLPGKKPAGHDDLSLPDRKTYTAVLAQAAPGSRAQRALEFEALTLRVLNHRDCAGILAQLRTAARTGKIGGIEPESIKDLSLSGVPGLEYRWVGSGSEQMERYYCLADRAYSLSAKWPRGRRCPGK
jgi:hypothetical protein